MAKFTVRPQFVFTDLGRNEPQKHSIESRRMEFKEIYQPYEKKDGKDQSALLPVEMSGTQLHSGLVEAGCRGANY
jgi:hypothetical protein